MSGGLIAVVDDNEAVLASLKFAMSALGFNVMPYRSAGSFLADASARPACLIVDQNMPGMNGLELVARIRGEGSSVPVLLATGFLTPEIAEKADLLGIESVFEKPMNLEDLLKFVTDYS